MNEKLRLLELANKKATIDNEFIGYILKKYGEIENQSDVEVRAKLNCSLEDYYRLSLCKTPEVNSNDFVEQLNRIATHSNVSMLELNTLIKRVISILKFSESQGNSFLMAARDKGKDNFEKPDSE